MSFERLFVAILPPPVVCAQLGALAEPLEGLCWVPEGNLHLTLRFLGDTAPERRERIEEALARVRVEPFILPVGGVGTFPPRGPLKVLWAGLGDAHPRLFQLRQRVDDALLSVDMTLDVRHFHPHLTLARIERDPDARGLERLLRRHRDFEGSPFLVDAFHLFSSELRPASPPIHRPLRRFALRTCP